jgi:hypothetical protein
LQSQKKNASVTPKPRWMGVIGRRQLLLPPATIVFAGFKPSSLVHHRAV